jgi:hypothetical protein
MGLMIAIFVSVGISQAQINSYVGATDGFWDEARFWSLATPPSISQSGIFITNNISKTVTIDSITANSFPTTLTIGNLTISSNSGCTNALALTDTSVTPLHIIDGLTISTGLLTVANSFLLVDGLSSGAVQNDGTIKVVDGSFIATNCSLLIGGQHDNSTGSLIVSNGFVLARDVTTGGGPVNASGGIEVSGGMMTLLSSLSLGLGADKSSGGLLVRNGGLFVVTNGAIVAGGFEGHGSINVTNAALLAGEIVLGAVARSSGGLGINDGTVTVNGDLTIASYASSGFVSLNGGVLAVTNGWTIVGNQQCSAFLTVSDGLFLAHEVFVGYSMASSGTMTIQGGKTIIESNLWLRYQFGQVSLSGGQLIVTNGLISVVGGYDYYPPLSHDSFNEQIVMTGGELSAKAIELGVSPNPYSMYAGLLSISGGSVTVSESVTLGDCLKDTIGRLVVNGGDVAVTNAAGTAFIDVREGKLILNNGTLRVDKLVMTNSCGQFVHAGGTLIVGQFVLDPNAFRITSVAKEGNDLRVTWILGPGMTNALQVAAGASNGSFSTNGFTDIFIVTNVTTIGTVTNYLDVGAATNSSSRYYRARLTP